MSAWQRRWRSLKSGRATDDSQAGASALVALARPLSACRYAWDRGAASGAGWPHDWPASGHLVAYTRRTLLNACLREIRSAETRVRIAALPDCRARLDKLGTSCNVTIDPYQSSMIEAAVHESLHALLDSGMLKMFSKHEAEKSLREVVMDALEKHLADHIMSDHGETERWRRALGRKLQKPSG